MNDANDNTDEQLAAKARELFNESVEKLDATTLSQLNQSRQRALERAARKPLVAHWQQWLPAAGMATAAVVAVVLWTGRPSIEPLAPTSTASDLDIILDVDDFEMLEDLEFYSWIDLDEQTESNVG